MGRKKSTCLQYFDLKKDDLSKCEKATCKYCGAVSAKNTVRMKLHLAKACKECPADVRETFAAELATGEESEVGETTRGTSEISDEEAADETFATTQTSEKSHRTAKSSKRKKRKIVPNRSNVAEENREIDRALADFLFAANLSISVVENPFFVAFCKKLRPSYNLPSRYRIVSQSFVGGASHIQTAVPVTTPSIPGLSEGTLGISPSGTLGTLGTIAIAGPSHQAVPAPDVNVHGLQFLRIIQSGTP